MAASINQNARNFLSTKWPRSDLFSASVENQSALGPSEVIRTSQSVPQYIQGVPNCLMLVLDAAVQEGMLSLTLEQIVIVLSEQIPSPSPTHRLYCAWAICREEWRARKIRIYGHVPLVLSTGGQRISDEAVTAPLRLSSASPVWDRLSWVRLRGILRCFQREEVRATPGLTLGVSRVAFCLDAKLSDIVAAIAEAPAGACRMAWAPWRLIQRSARGLSMTQPLCMVIILKDAVEARHGDWLQRSSPAYPPYGSDVAIEINNMTAATMESLAGLLHDIEDSATMRGESLTLALLLAHVHAKRCTNSPTPTAGAFLFAWEKLQATCAAKPTFEISAAAAPGASVASDPEPAPPPLPFDLDARNSGCRSHPAILKTVTTLNDSSDFNIGGVTFEQEGMQNHCTNETVEVNRGSCGNWITAPIDLLAPFEGPSYIKTSSTFDRLEQCAAAPFEGPSYIKTNSTFDPLEQCAAAPFEGPCSIETGGRAADLDLSDIESTGDTSGVGLVLGDDWPTEGSVRLCTRFIAHSSSALVLETQVDEPELSDKGILDPFLVHFGSDLLEHRNVYLNKLSHTFKLRSGRSMDYRKYGFERLTGFLASIPGLEIVGSRQMTRVRIADQVKFVELLGELPERRIHI
jgi:hypothetical protein